MPFGKERMTDLFIPIGRPRSRSPTGRTNSSVDTSNAAAATNSVSTTPTTVSSHQSTRNGFPRTTSTESPLRYTIVGPAPGVRANQMTRSTEKSNQNERPNSVHIRHHSGKSAASSSPIRELTMRLSKATGSDLSESIDLSKAQTARPTLPLRDALHIGEPSKKATPATPFVSPEITPVPIDTANLPHMRTSPLSINTISEEQAIAAPKVETPPSSLIHSDLLRSYSQASNRSDRSCPPPSFPPAFYDKNINQRSPPKVLSRSNSARASTRTSSRSASPLKFVISNHESNMLRVPSSKRQTHRRHSSETAVQKRDEGTAGSNTPNQASDRDSSSFHRVIHHYTDCVHTSPPSTRPLNLQPKLDDSYNPPRSTISGLCFDCDTAERRDAETSILLSYNTRIVSHTATLEAIVIELETVSPVSPMSPTTPSAQFQSLNIGDTLQPPTMHTLRPDIAEQGGRHASYSSGVSDDIDSEEMAIRMEVLEDRIKELSLLRDKEVKEVWKGYTERWGPGMLGFLRGIEADRATIGTTATGLSSRMSTASGHSAHSTAEGRMKVDWIRNALSGPK